MEKIRFKDLSFWLKLAIIYAWVITLLLGYGMLRAFWEGLNYVG